jgi:hypothetical protein
MLTLPVHTEILSFSNTKNGAKDVWFRHVSLCNEYLYVILFSWLLKGSWVQEKHPTIPSKQIFSLTGENFNNISAISWWSVLLEEDINGNFQYQEKVTWLSSATDKLYHIMLYQVHLSMDRIQLTSLVAMVINCIDTWI